MFKRIAPFIFLLVFSCKAPGDKKIEYEILSKFIEFDEDEYVDQKYIEKILYDIQSPTDTMGRAFQISENLFLTNHHVISSIFSGKYAQLVKQENRGFLEDLEGEFDIIHHDAQKDIALLRLKNGNEEEEEKSYSRIYNKIFKKDRKFLKLHDKVLQGKDKVSEFIRFDGKDIKHKGYYLSFGGHDLYDKKVYVDTLGGFILPPNSALFEKKGYVLPFREKEVKELIKNSKLPFSPANEVITSIPVYQGESGSPVFLETQKNKFYLAGITTKTLSVGETISTPGHPLGILGYDRTVSFIVHRQAIHQFIKDYLKKLQKEIKND